jgi:polyferredoxin
VEGFLPIGALMAWKRFALTGVWDPVHPAGMVILGFACLVSLLLRKAFCGWFCPVGTLSEWLWKAGRRRRGRNLRLPAAIDLPLRGLKYILLGFFVFVIFHMPLPLIEQFLDSPYYRLADVKMLHFFTHLSLTTAMVLAALVALSIPMRNFWCRYLCPYGALMGLLALISPSRVRRESRACTQCGQCTQACPYHLPVSRLSAVGSPECNGCLDCTRVCPVPGALIMETVPFRRHAWRIPHFGLTLILVFVLSVYAAQISGRWQSRVSTHEFRQELRMADAPASRHPSVDFGRN